MRVPFQAVKDVSYPAVPATWPNRAVRRAVRFGRSLPATWAGFFMVNPDFKAAVMKSRFVGA